MKNFRKKGFSRIAILLFVMATTTMLGQTSNLMGFDANGKLTYKKDGKGNKIPDFSYVGYFHGEKDIPNVTVVKSISPVGGDNWSHIQNAIREVEKRSPNSNGFRGALLLKAGTYRISKELKITKSGVVLRGEGDKTVLIATRREKSDFIVFQGSGKATGITNTRKKITQGYVPIGAQTVTVQSGHNFKKGDRIFVERKPNDAWIKALKMDKLTKTKWKANDYIIKYKRIVTQVNANKITFDAPMVDVIDPKHAEGFLYKYSWSGRLENVGIERMRLESVFSSNSDEKHAWDAITFRNTENAWARNINAYYFGYSCVNVERSSSKISILDSKMLDPKSKTSGGRKYSFNCDGEQILFKNCLARGGRHDFVTGSKVPGPNVYVNCTSQNQKSTTGPHHRWATGILFDNVKGTKAFAAENRRNSGTGHGWAGAQTMFWNCTSPRFVMHDPPGDHRNWAIGCKGPITNKGSFATEPLAYVESRGTFLNPRSLYEKQLADRLKKPVTGGNTKPVVSFKKPSGNPTVQEGYTLTVEAIASDKDGSISGVQLFVNNKLIREEKVAPYEWGHEDFPNELRGLKAGKHTFKVTATDNKGAKASDTFTLTVQKKGGPDPDPNPSNCNFGTPLSRGISAKDKVVYTKVYVVGNGGPTLSNFRKFTINWVPGNNGLYQFAINTNNGSPDWYVDFKNTMRFQLKNAKPEVTLRNTGFAGLDGAYWVAETTSSLILVSKNKGYSIHFSNAGQKPSCSNKANDDLVQTSVQIDRNPFGDTLVLSNISSDVVQVQLFDYNGRKITTTMVTNGEQSITLPTGDVPRGVYLIKVMYIEKAPQILKAVKN